MMGEAEAIIAGPGAEEQNGSRDQSGGAESACEFLHAPTEVSNGAAVNMAEHDERQESQSFAASEIASKAGKAAGLVMNQDVSSSPFSTEKESFTGPVCKHVQKGAQPVVIKAKVARLKALCSCEECEKARVVRGKGAKKGKGKGAIVTPERPTKSAAPKDLWLCLACGCVSCSATADGGSKQTAKGSGKVPPPMLSHVKNHASHKQHPLFLNLGTLECWCAKCEKGGAFIDYSAASEGLPSGASGAEESVAGVSVHAETAPASQHRGIAECAALIRESQGGPVAKTSSVVKPESNEEDCPAKASFAESEEEDASVGSEATSGDSRVVGFSNLGNTCFFNSVLQNLAAVQPLQFFFLGGQEEGRNDPPTEGPLTAALRGFYTDLSRLSSGAGSLVKDVSSPGKALKKVGGKHKGGKNVQRRGNASAYSPSRLFSAVCTKAPRFKGFEQQDAHELLRYLLDGLDTEELAVRKRAQRGKRNEGPERRSSAKSKRVGSLPNKAPAEEKGAVREEEALSEDATVPAEESQPASCSKEAKVVSSNEESQESGEGRMESMKEETEGTSNGESDRAKEGGSQGNSNSSGTPADTSEEPPANGSKQKEEGHTERSKSNGTTRADDTDLNQLDDQSLPAPRSSNGNADFDGQSNKSVSLEAVASTSQPTRESSGQLPEATFVQRIFGGKLSSTVVCLPCGHSSSVEEPFLDLSLPLPAPGGPKTGGSASPRKEKVVSARWKSSEGAKKKAQTVGRKTSEGERQESAQQVAVQVQDPTDSAYQGADGRIEASTRVVSGKPDDCPRSVTDERDTEAAEKSEERGEEVNDGREPSTQPSTANEGAVESADGRPGSEDASTGKDSHESNSPAEVTELTQSKGGPASSSLAEAEEGQSGGAQMQVESANKQGCTGAEPTDKARHTEGIGGGASIDEQTAGVGQDATSGVAQNEDQAGTTVRQEEDSRDQSKLRIKRVHWADCDSLPVPAAMSLEGCLFSFTREEVLEGENVVTCEECTKAARAEEGMTDVGPKGENSAKEETRPLGEEGSLDRNGDISAREGTRSMEKEGTLGVKEAEGHRDALETGSEETSAGSTTDDHGSENALVEGMAELHLEAPICSSEKDLPENESRFENGDASHALSEESEAGSGGERAEEEKHVPGDLDRGAGQTDVQPDSAQDADGFTASPAKQKGRGKPRGNGGQSQKQTALSNGFASLADAASGDESEADASIAKKPSKSSSRGDVAVRRTATKRFLIAEAPPILTVHLKRFRQDVKGRLSKIGGHVSFGEWLDLGPYLDRGRTNKGSTTKVETQENGFSNYINRPAIADVKLEARYRLIGCVEHSGSMRGGHYVAYVRGSCRQLSGSDRQLLRAGEKDRGGDETWWYISDTHVQRFSLAAVLKCEAYLLFYERGN